MCFEQYAKYGLHTICVSRIIYVLKCALIVLAKHQHCMIPVKYFSGFHEDVSEVERVK